MGVLSFFTNLIAPLKTSQLESASETKSVESVKKTAKNEPIKMVSDESMSAEKNEDSIKINQATREQLYKQIEELCANYRMSMEDVKRVGLLEKIAGCSTEELLKKSNDEISKYIKALKHTLKYLSWKLPWQNRTVDDIEKIAKKSNDRMVYQATSKRSWISELFRSKKSLKKELEKNGYELSEQSLKSYMSKVYSGLIESGKSPEEAYAKLYEKYGDLLIDTKDPHQREILTGAIVELRATDRREASELTMRSCACDSKCEQAVARGLSNNYEEISCTADDFGECPTMDEDIGISHIAFAHLSDEDATNALAKMSTRRAELEEKIQNGKTLTEKEQLYFNKAQIYQYSGAMTGICANNNLTQQSELLSTIDRDTEEFGIREQVYTTAAEYVENHQNSLPINAKTFTETVDKSTGNNYSQVLANSTNSTTTTVTQNSNSNKSERDVVAQSQKTDANKTKTPSSSDTETSNYKSNLEVGTVETSNSPSFGDEYNLFTSPVVSSRKKTSQSFICIENNSEDKNQIPAKTVSDDSTNSATQRSAALDISNCKTDKDCNEYIDNYGKHVFIKQAYSNNNLGHVAEEKAERLYASSGSGEQMLILEGLNAKGVSALLDKTKGAVLNRLKDVKLSSTYATNEKDNEIEKMKKENNISLA